MLCFENGRPPVSFFFTTTSFSALDADKRDCRSNPAASAPCVPIFFPTPQIVLGQWKPLVLALDKTK